ncbi:MAG TPA: hypothetical protein VGS21_06990 [Acidimicrobiales bacterium]|nr:hypothetical protein [Acidimicrobiales bacterium]
MDPERTPVVVAAGQLTCRERDLTPLELATRAAEIALSESPRLRAKIEKLSVVNILSRTVGHRPASRVASALGLDLAPGALETTTVSGSTPQWLVQRAASDIAAGRLSAAVITGAEGVRSGRMRGQGEAREPRPHEDEDASMEADAVIGDARIGSSDAEIAAGLFIPVYVYPVIESALAARDDRDPAAQRAFVSELLARFSGVAARHPDAWFPVERSAEEIATPAPDNRLVAEPYTKLMTAFLGAAQGAAVVVTSLAVARELAIDDGAMFVRASATANDVWYPSERPDLTSSPAIAAAGAAALDAAGVGLDELDFIDLYSCFPCAVQIGAEALGLGLDDPRGLTITGGLPYFGGPGNNYASHSIATLFTLLRERGGHGLITALGWYVTKHAAGCYSATPGPSGFRVGDTTEDQESIDASARPCVAPAEHLDPTRARVVGGTVTYGHDGEVTSAPVIADLADGRRVVAAAAPDECLLRSLAGRSLVGETVEVSGSPQTYRLG